MFIKPKDLKLYIDTDNSGNDKDNPNVKELPSSYKLALYLGYTLKWGYDSWYTDIWNRDIQYRIRPVFKKSYDTYDVWYFHSNWNSMFDVLIPKLKEDNRLTDEIKKVIFECDQMEVIKVILKDIDKLVPDIKNPFTNIEKLPVRKL